MKVFQHAPHTAWVRQELVSETEPPFVYVSDLASSETYSFGGSAEIIWCLLEKPQSLDGVVKAVASAYGESEEVVRVGTENFIYDLLERGLLAESSEGNS